jgi:hypothetical protein
MVELLLHFPTSIGTQCLIKHRKNFTFLLFYINITGVQWWVLKIMVQYLWGLLQGSWLVRISGLLVITDMTPKHKEKQVARGPDAACAGYVPIKFLSSLSFKKLRGYCISQPGFNACRLY